MKLLILTACEGVKVPNEKHASAADGYVLTQATGEAFDERELHRKIKWRDNCAAETTARCTETENHE